MENNKEKLRAEIATLEQKRCEKQEELNRLIREEDKEQSVEEFKEKYLHKIIRERLTYVSLCGGVEESGDYRFIYVEEVKGKDPASDAYILSGKTISLRNSKRYLGLDDTKWTDYDCLDYENLDYARDTDIRVYPEAVERVYTTKEVGAAIEEHINHARRFFANFLKDINE